MLGAQRHSNSFCHFCVSTILASILFRTAVLRRHTYLCCLENFYLGPVPLIWIWMYFLGHLSNLWVTNTTNCWILSTDWFIWSLNCYQFIFWYSCQHFKSLDWAFCWKIGRCGSTGFVPPWQQFMWAAATPFSEVGVSSPVCYTQSI